jgi:hypothetical protein
MSLLWPDLLPEMQDEVRARLDVQARCRLRVTCRRMYGTDKDYRLPPVLARVTTMRKYSESRKLARDFCEDWMALYGQSVFVWLTHVWTPRTRSPFLPRNYAYVTDELASTVLDSDAAHAKSSLRVRKTDADGHDRLVVILRRRTAPVQWEFCAYTRCECCNDNDNSRYATRTTYPSLSALLADKGAMLCAIVLHEDYESSSSSSGT